MVLSFSTTVLSFPAEALSFSTIVLSFSTMVLSFPAEALSFSTIVLSFSTTVLSKLSFSNRGLELFNHCPAGLVYITARGLLDFAHFTALIYCSLVPYIQFSPCLDIHIIIPSLSPSTHGLWPAVCASVTEPLL